MDALRPLGDQLVNEVVLAAKLATIVTNPESVAIAQSVLKWVPAEPVVAKALEVTISAGEIPVAALIGLVIDGVFTVPEAVVVTAKEAVVEFRLMVTVVVVFNVALAVWRIAKV